MHKQCEPWRLETNILEWEDRSSGQYLIPCPQKPMWEALYASHSAGLWPVEVIVMPFIGKTLELTYQNALNGRGNATKKVPARGVTVWV